MFTNALEDSIMIAISKMNEGISRKEIKIYRNTIEQGFERPCFYIKQLRVERRERIKRFHTRKYLFDVHYFPGDSIQAREELNTIQDLLYAYLYEIHLGEELIRAISLDSEIHDNVVHFFVSYKLYLREEPEDMPKMKTLDYRGGTKIDEEENK